MSTGRLDPEPLRWPDGRMRGESYRDYAARMAGAARAAQLDLERAQEEIARLTARLRAGLGGSE